MNGRRRARQTVFQLIFQGKFKSNQTRTAELEFIANRLHGNDNLVVFAQNLLSGVRDHQKQIDVVIGKHATNWKLERISTTDLATLRLGIYEILFTDTPKPVVINEAIELAKRFGNKQSGRFVNGILDHVTPEDLTTEQSKTTEDVEVDEDQKSTENLKSIKPTTQSPQ